MLVSGGSRMGPLFFLEVPIKRGAPRAGVGGRDRDAAPEARQHAEQATGASRHSQWREGMTGEDAQKTAALVKSKHLGRHGATCEAVPGQWGFCLDGRLDRQMGLTEAMAPRSDLTVRFASCEVTQKQVDELARYLKTHGRGLGRLSMTLGFGHFRATELRLKPLWDAIRGMKRLTHLDVDISGPCLAQRDGALLAISKTAHLLPELRRLALNIAQNAFPDGVICRAFQQLAKAKHLQALVVDLAAVDALHDETLATAFAELKRLSSLRELTLRAAHNFKLGRAAIRELGDVLRHTVALEKLHLDVSSTAVGDAEMGALARRFLELPTLRELELSAHATACTADGLREFRDAAAQRVRDGLALRGVTIHALLCRGLDRETGYRYGREMAECKLPVRFCLARHDYEEDTVPEWLSMTCNMQ